MVKNNTIIDPIKGLLNTLIELLKSPTANQPTTIIERKQGLAEK
jgi:hypothetical protein